MARFNIIQTHSEQYKKQILEFWQQYLPGTPPERFDWMKNNPAGPAIWFLAFEEGSNNLAGMISIMPKEMIRDGQTIKAGIMGDFMVDSRYRPFGPALDLQKTVVQEKAALGFDIIYTLPNPASTKIAQRVGFKEITELHHFVKPIDVTYYLNKYIPKSLSVLITPLAEQALKIFSKETFLSSKGYCEEVSNVDRQFDVLWDKIKYNQSGLIGDHGSAYLRWRYLQNPLFKFRLLTYRDHSNGELLGYIVFTINHRKMEIFDIIASQKSCADKLLKKIIRLGRSEGCQAIYTRLSETNSLLKGLRPFRFFESKDDACILSVGKNNSPCEPWDFFEGDRNI